MNRLVALTMSTMTLGSFPLSSGGTQEAGTAPDTHIVALADSVFGRLTPAAPGCVVGVARGGEVLLERAYGLANLEHSVPLTASSILEAGSVSKQFTAAAVTLLALDGKLRFDDPIQKHFPELPDYGAPVTVRMLLDHTSGLRDWGNIASLAGWPRGSRAYTHPHVLEIIARQRSLNYAPGSRYSYTNSGYSLLAMLVERVSGMPFAQFTHERLFTPLGMTHTSWRDDFRRIVPGRAQAYERSATGFAEMRLDMPFEDTHGHGGLLTTVGDLIKWNESLSRRTLGGALVDSLTRQGVLTDGTTISYAAGLVIDEYRGTPRIAHSGSTAGYRAYVARYPEQRNLSLAVLCNTGHNASALVHGMVDGLATGLGPAPARGASGRVAGPVTQPAAEALRTYVGDYASDEVGVTIRVALRDGRLTIQRPPETPTRLNAVDDGRFSPGGSFEVWFTTDEASGEPLLHAAMSRAYDVVFRRVPIDARRAPGSRRDSR